MGVSSEGGNCEVPIVPKVILLCYSSEEKFIKGSAKLIP